VHRALLPLCLGESWFYVAVAVCHCSTVLGHPEYLFLAPLSLAAERAALSNLRYVLQDSMVSARLRARFDAECIQSLVSCLCATSDSMVTQSQAQAELDTVRDLAAAAVIDAPSPQTGAALLTQLTAVQRSGRHALSMTICVCVRACVCACVCACACRSRKRCSDCRGSSSRVAPRHSTRRGPVAPLADIVKNRLIQYHSFSDLSLLLSRESMRASPCELRESYYRSCRSETAD
jgi:hypothetical protein